MKLCHEVKLIPPSDVKRFVRRGAKNGAADAAAICEAVRRPHMRFVSVKSESNQGSRVCRLAGADPASKLERGAQLD